MWNSAETTKSRPNSTDVAGIRDWQADVLQEYSDYVGVANANKHIIRDWKVIFGY